MGFQKHLESSWATDRLAYQQILAETDVKLHPKNLSGRMLEGNEV
jgi:hypothetical protein